MLRGFYRWAYVEMEEQKFFLNTASLFLSLLSASSGFICVGSPVSLSSQTAVEVSGAAVRYLPTPFLFSYIEFKYFES